MNYQTNEQAKQTFSPSNDRSSGLFYGKTFGWFAGFLLLTAIFTLGLSYLFNVLWPIVKDGEINEASATTYKVLTIVSSIGVLVSSIVATYRAMKHKKGGIISGILYVLFMSFLLSSLSFYIQDTKLIGLAILITSSLFIVMCLIGFIFKGKVKWFVALAMGAMFGALIIYLINNFLLLSLVFNGNQDLYNAYIGTYYAAEFLFLIYALVITTIDMIRIKKFAENFPDDTSNNMALYFALNLYNDFILILLKVISFLLRNKSRE